MARTTNTKKRVKTTNTKGLLLIGNMTGEVPMETKGVLHVGTMTGEVRMETKGESISVNKIDYSSTNIIPINFDTGDARRAL